MIIQVAEIEGAAILMNKSVLFRDTAVRIERMLNEVKMATQEPLNYFSRYRTALLL